MKLLSDLDDGRLAFVADLAPRASRTEVVGWSKEGHLKIRVKAAPVEGGANRQLIRFLSKLLDVRQSEVTIAAGAKSRTKRLVVPATCKNRLLSFVDIC
jgi:uncharacterized protein (TIGR00251 family)